MKTDKKSTTKSTIKSATKSDTKSTTTLFWGIVLMLLSTIFLALMNALLKYLTMLGYSSMENVFFRAFFMVLTLYSIILFFPALSRISPRIKKPKLQAKQKGGFSSLLMRGLFGGVAVSIAYYNFATIPLGIATAFLQSTPIFVVFLSFFTRSKPSVFALVATIVGFIGVLLVANPEASEIPLFNALIGIIGAIFAAIAFLTIPTLKRFYTSEAVVLWYGIMMCIVGIIGMCVSIDKMGGFIFPSLFAWILFILTGVVGTIGQWLMTKSYMFASPNVVAPITYMRIVWSVFLGVLLGDSFPNLLPSIGIALILLSGALIGLNAIKKDSTKDSVSDSTK
ncbi:DMT family transporter [Helicobacter sp. T3_23-1059]